MGFSAVQVSSVHLTRSALSVTTLLFIHPLALQHSRPRKRYHMGNEWILPGDLPCGAPRDTPRQQLLMREEEQTGQELRNFVDCLEPVRSEGRPQMQAQPGCQPSGAGLPSLLERCSNHLA